MRTETEYLYGCNEEFAELCALSTSGELSADELAVVEEHVVACARCASLLRQYSGLVEVGMAKLAAANDQEIEAPFGYNRTRSEERLVEAFHDPCPATRSKLQSPVNRRSDAESPKKIKRPAVLIATAAAVLVCSSVSLEIGRRMAAFPANERPAVVQTPAPPDREKMQLRAELAVAQESLGAIVAKSANIERQVAVLSSTNSSLLVQIGELSGKADADSAELASVTEQRDGLQRELKDTSTALIRARDDLNRAQQDRQGALLRVATLENRVNELDTRLSQVNNSPASEEKLLVADRDIRELMGARQLYIADVVDVQNNGERSKPFGRVFYTKGKSLIFYAFDLQGSPGYRDAKAFQAWGKPDVSSGKPISLGIFYVDSEQNRRWVVKSENPDVLARINAVFVTVEPRGGSQKPTGKPFLEAYLHSLAPNHP